MLYARAFLTIFKKGYEMRIVYAVNNESEENRLKNIPQIEILTGCYKGVVETSFIEKINNQDDFNNALNYAIRFNQESVLVIDENNNATLISLDNGEKITAGVWTKVNSAEGLENYSIDKNENIFTCL